MVGKTTTRALVTKPALAKKSDRADAISRRSDREIVATNSKDLPQTIIGAAGNCTSRRHRNPVY